MSASEDIVRGIASKLNVLDGDGQLMELDSLTVLDFVTEIEDSTGKTVPTTQIRRATFESLATIIALVDRL
jgi:acyl carrier protein